MRIKELRAKAREDSQGNKWKLTIPIFCLTVVLYLLGAIPEYLPDGIVKIIVTILAIIATVFISITASYAIIIRTIKITRKEELSGFFSDMFGEGIKNGFSCVWGIIKKLLSWIILLIVGYCLIFVGSLSGETTNLLFNVILPIIGSVLVILSAIKIMLMGYDYYLITYLKHDYPEKSTSELLDKSKEMMEGNKAKAFVIPLTFFGWFLLSALLGALVGVIFNLIWPVNILGSSTIPAWAELLKQIITYFITSFVSTYLFVTYVEFYYERNPLEIYHEDYVKPETNPSKYNKIMAWTIILFILCYFVIAFIIFYQASTLTNNAINSLSNIMENTSLPSEY